MVARRRARRPGVATASNINPRQKTGGLVVRSGEITPPGRPIYGIRWASRAYCTDRVLSICDLSHQIVESASLSLTRYGLPAHDHFQHHDDHRVMGKPHQLLLEFLHHRTEKETATGQRVTFSNRGSWFATIKFPNASTLDFLIRGRSLPHEMLPVRNRRSGRPGHESAVAFCVVRICSVICRAK
jgi:hypothetical protein